MPTTTTTPTVEELWKAVYKGENRRSEKKTPPGVKRKEYATSGFQLGQAKVLTLSSGEHVLGIDCRARYKTWMPGPDGNALVAGWIKFRLANIDWTRDATDDVIKNEKYTTPCPAGSNAAGPRFPLEDAGQYQIVGETRGAHWWGGFCGAQTNQVQIGDALFGHPPTDYLFWVNDSNHDDNGGWFTVIIDEVG